MYLSLNRLRAIGRLSSVCASVTTYDAITAQHSRSQASHHSQNFILPKLDSLSNFRKSGVPYPVTYTSTVSI